MTPTPPGIFITTIFFQSCSSSSLGNGLKPQLCDSPILFCLKCSHTHYYCIVILSPGVLQNVFNTWCLLLNPVIILEIPGGALSPKLGVSYLLAGFLEFIRTLLNFQAASQPVCSLYPVCHSDSKALPLSSRAAHLPSTHFSSAHSTPSSHSLVRFSLPLFIIKITR